MTTSAQNTGNLLSSDDPCSGEGYGFVNVKDPAQSIPPVYCDAKTFYEGLAAVKKGEKWGFIDPRNVLAVPFQFDYVRSFKHGQAIVHRGKFYGVINTKGSVVIQPHYYDLMPYELEGKQYYISRDSTFFQGIIDPTGKEVLPHQFTYIITYQPNLSNQNLYNNIPFFTAYQSIDTTKGSFYEQFSEQPLHFSPDKGRQDIYDKDFNRLASKSDSSFQHQALSAIDAYLDAHPGQGVEEQKAEIQALLQSDETGNVDDRPVPDTGPTPQEELDAYMADIGFVQFSGKDGKMGVKKDGVIVLPAIYEVITWWKTSMHVDRHVDLSYLKTHFAGSFTDPNERIFELYCIGAGSREKGALFSMTGNKVLDLENNRIPERTTPIGLVYKIVVRDTANVPYDYKFGLMNWKGEPVLAPEYKAIRVLAGGYILTKQKKTVSGTTQMHFGLSHSEKKVVIPQGTFSNIEPFPHFPNLYIAEWDDVYPSIKEQELKIENNKHFVLLRVEGDKYSVAHKFIASKVYPRSLDKETKLLKYKVKLGEINPERN